jgi:hypothetical protein
LIPLKWRSLWLSLIVGFWLVGVSLMMIAQAQARLRTESPAHQPPNVALAAVKPTSPVMSATLYLPVLNHNYPWPCPTVSTNQYGLLSASGPPINHPDYLHGDLNLALRGYLPFTSTLDLIRYEGETDEDPPQLIHLFADQRPPQFVAVNRPFDWLWDPDQCDGNPRGCRGEPILTGEGHLWEAAVTGLAAAPGEAVYLPTRHATLVNKENYRAVVLYAEATRLTLGYTRDDSVANGYAVHLENICVDPNLLSLYKAQIRADGYRLTDYLPALRNGQPLGLARTEAVLVAVRDRGQFMDPRSQKDWWQTIPPTGLLHVTVEHPTGP